MNYCKNCVLPDTRPNLTLKDGVCDACLGALEKPLIDWNKRRKNFEKIVYSVKKLNRPFDCLIPVSGGKDSTWQVIKALEFGLVPLCITWRTPARNEIGQKNLDNLINLGVSHIDLTINPIIEKKFTLKSFKKFGSPVIPMHMAIHALPTQISIEKNIPLILWGENSASEYGGDDDVLKGTELNREWLLQYGVTNGTTSEDWIDDELSEKSLSPYAWPEEKTLKKQNIKAIFLGQFFKWDPVVTAKIASDHGFVKAQNAIIGTYDFADIDDAFLMSIHHWLKWYKFGFTRSWDNLSIEIREKRKSRLEAIEDLKSLGTNTPYEEIEKFCNYVEIRKKDFFEIAESFRNPKIWKKVNGTWKIKNFLIEDWVWKNEY